MGKSRCCGKQQKTSQKYTFYPWPRPPPTGYEFESLSNSTLLRLDTKMTATLYKKGNYKLQPRQTWQLEPSA